MSFRFIRSQFFFHNTIIITLTAPFYSSNTHANVIKFRDIVNRRGKKPVDRGEVRRRWE